MNLMNSHPMSRKEIVFADSRTDFQYWCLGQEINPEDAIYVRDRYSLAGVGAIGHVHIIGAIENVDSEAMDILASIQRHNG